MSRSLGIPAVVGLHDVTDKLESGQRVLSMVMGQFWPISIRLRKRLWHYGELNTGKSRWRSN